MSSSNKNDGVVIDVVPEQTVQTGRAPGAASAPPRNTKASEEPAGLLAKSSGLFGLIALLIVVALAMFGYVGWATFRHDLAALEQRLGVSLERQEELSVVVREANQTILAQQGVLATQEAQLRATLAEYRETAAAQKRADEQREMQLAAAQSAAAARAAELRDAIAEVHRRVGGSGNQWMVAEAMYLTRLAVNRMQFAHDVTTARTALAQADQRLHDTHDPGWEDIRERLAQDISALNALAMPDFAALTERLERLIVQLPITRVSTTAAAPRSSAPNPAPTRQSAARDRSLSNLFDNALSGLQNAVRIRRHDQPLQPLPGSAQEFFHNQNLQLQLTTAQLAVARRQPALYHRSLQRAAQILEALGAAGHQAAQAMRLEIDDLAGIVIAPPLPDLGATLHALETRYKQHNGVVPGANSVKPADMAE